MGMYAAIGVTQAIFTFGMGAAISLLTYFASASLHAQSTSKLFFAPMSWFASIPLGRLMSVYGKDVDVLDSLLADSIRMTTMILGNAVSSIALVSVYFPYFLIAIFVVFWGYVYFWRYYRASSREIKRLDSMLRSLLYGHCEWRLGRTLPRHHPDESICLYSCRGSWRTFNSSCVQ